MFGAVLMLVAIGIAWTIDGVSGQRLMLQHQQQNLHLDDDVAPLADIDEEAGGYLSFPLSQDLLVGSLLSGIL